MEPVSSKEDEHDAEGIGKRTVNQQRIQLFLNIIKFYFSYFYQFFFVYYIKYYIINTKEIHSQETKLNNKVLK